MRTIILTLFIALGFFAKAQFQDNFTDGNFTSNPIWIGDTDSFEVDLSNQLHLNAPSNSQESYLAVPSLAAVDGYWEFYVDLDFNPSGSNRAYVYLISDQANLKGSLNGYYVLVGSTSDEVSLYRQNGTSSSEIIDGIDGTVAISPKVKIKVTRDLFGNFELFTDTSLTFTNPISEGSVFDNNYMSSTHFGVLCDYSSTRSDKFFFDDFDVTAQQFVDVFPAKVSNFEITSLNTLKLNFNEELTSISAENNSNYTVNNSIGNASSSIYNNADNSVVLTFSNNFMPGINYSLSANNLEDLNTNVLDTNIAFKLNAAYNFEDIIFNEILADETPSFGLPTFEFLEFKNLTADTLFTEAWFLSDFTDTTYFSADTILPNEYVIIGNTSAETFYEGFGKTFGLSSFISLNKTEDLLTLYDQYGTVLDSLHYFDDWFAGATAPNGDDKVDGGWSLSRISDNYPCSSAGNWTPSNDALGGSPGEINSFNSTPGSTAPKFTSATFINDTTIQLIFDQEIVGGNDIANYEVSALNTDLVETQQITNVSGSGNMFFATIAEAVNLDYIYSISLTNIQNCAGVAMLENTSDVYFIKSPEVGDLVLNEILSNPYTGAQDYIEIYNTTNQAIDLNGLSFIEYYTDYTDSIQDASAVLTSNYVLPPNAYFTFSEDTESVFLNYIVDKPEWLFELNIPNLADKEGDIAIVFFDSIIIDRLHYFSRWNFELLDTDNGVALERIKASGETQDDANWASAAAGVGFGTPTAKNSMAFVDVEQEGIVTVSPEVFTPNQDGIDDFALINYTLDQAGYVADVGVYDVVGRKIKDLATKETIGAEGFWKWDGTNYNREKAKIGMYVVLVSLFDLDGKKKQYKKTVVLGTQF
ncbi:MAG: lamin tail domain-containing protein [Chitinophagales bacterium]